MDLLPQHLVNGLALGSTYALVAMGLTLVFGVLLIPNFAHGEFCMVGAFVSYTLVALGFNFWLAVLAAACVIALLGVLVDRLVFRPLETAPGLTLMIASLGTSIILQELAHLIWGSAPRTTPMPLPGVIRTGMFSITYYQIVLFVALMAIWGGLWLTLHRSRLGLAIRAVSQLRDAAQLMGINLDRVRIATFLIGAGIGGLSGALLGAMYPIYPSVGVNPILKAFVVLVLGGIGNLWGAVLGGLVLGVVEVMVAGYVSSELQDAGSFLILVLVLLVRPQGLLGRAQVER